MERKTHSIKYNFSMNAILSASTFIFPLITFPYLTRVLGAEGNGIISFYSSVASYFSMVAALGIPTYGIRACAQVRDDKDKLSKTVLELLIINTIVTFFVVVVYIACFIFVKRFQQYPLIYILNGLTILLNVFGMNWLFQAIEQYDYITIRSLIVKIGCIVLMLIFVKQAKDYTIQAAISILAVSGANIINYIRAHKFVDFHRKRFVFDLKRHIKPIMILFAQTLAVSVYINLDMVMLGFLKTDTDVGYYNAAVKIKYVLMSIVNSLGQVLLPRMSFYAKSKKEKEFNEITNKSFRFTLLLSFPLASYFVLYAMDTMMLLAGNEYMDAVLTMQIITISIIPIGLTSVIGTQVLTAMEKEKYVLISVIFGAVFDFSLNLFLIPLWGAAGAALSTVLCEFLVLAVQILFAKGILSSVVKRVKIYKYFMASLLACAAGAIIKLFCLESHFLVLLLSSSLFFLVYIVCLLGFKEEFVGRIIKGLFTRIKSRYNKA